MHQCAVLQTCHPIFSYYVRWPIHIYFSYIQSHAVVTTHEVMQNKTEQSESERLTISSANVFMCMFCWREGTVWKARSNRKMTAVYVPHVQTVHMYGAIKLPMDKYTQVLIVAAHLKSAPVMFFIFQMRIWEYHGYMCPIWKWQYLLIPNNGIFFVCVRE